MTSSTPFLYLRQKRAEVLPYRLARLLYEAILGFLSLSRLFRYANPSMVLRHRVLHGHEGGLTVGLEGQAPSSSSGMTPTLESLADVLD